MSQQIYRVAVNIKSNSTHKKKMRQKQKLLKQKAQTQRLYPNQKKSPPLNPTPTHKQYLLSHLHYDNPNYNNKQNYNSSNLNIISSLPTQSDYHLPAPTAGYEGTNYNRRFKTQTGYEPVMTSSMLVDGDGDWDGDSGVRRRKANGKGCQGVRRAQEDRPVTFGISRRHEEMKSSVQYKEDIKMKNQILDELSSLRKSQQTLYGSKDYTATGFEDVTRCANHHNKRAKYRLKMDSHLIEDDEMAYCSKCAINLLQQGFKVEQINLAQTRKKSISQPRFPSIPPQAPPQPRIPHYTTFLHTLSETQKSLTNSLSTLSSTLSTISQKSKIKKNETNSIYNSLISQLECMRDNQIQEIQIQQNKVLEDIEQSKFGIQGNLEAVRLMRNEVIQIRDRILAMDHKEFQFLVEASLNRIKAFTSVSQGNCQLTIQPLEKQIDHIIINLCEFVKKIKQSSLAQQHKTKGCQDQFICKQIKGPFRTLFPDDDTGHDNEESPKFERRQHQPSRLQKSVQNNQYY